jgi:sulfate adenylyltransferase small subunit
VNALEDEAVFVMREVAAEFERPVLLFSGGKDSIVLLRLAEKAFRPAKFPCPILHIDTGHNFPEVLEFRDRRVAELGEQLIVARVQDSIDAGRAFEDGPSRNRLQTVTLLDALREGRFDAAFGGARRDEERARAKERVLSFRDELGQWEPRNQRPEVWELFNTVVRRGESVRALPRPAGSSPLRSRSPTGPSSTSGATSRPSGWRSRRSTTPTSARSSSATGCCSRSRSSPSPTARRCSPSACATAPWAISR